MTTNKSVFKTLPSDPELKAKLAESGIDVATSTLEDVQRLIARDIKLHAELVKASGMTPQ